MSRENSEIAQQLIEAANQRDVDAFVALVSPDVEWEDSPFWSEPARIYRGSAEVREWFNRALATWESIHLEVEEITEATNERVFVGAVFTALGRGSGVETQLHVWFVVRIADGKIARRQAFLDRDQALEAAGLEE